MINVDRVLSHCKAKTHNTLAAATMSNKGDRCICPHAVSLARESRPNMYRSTGIPYFVNNDCPAVTHNTLSSYYQRKGQSCRCPGAIIARNANLDRLAREKRERRALPANPLSGGRQGVAVISIQILPTAPIPAEMKNGACLRPENLHIVDLGFSGLERDRLVAKTLCWNDCPKKAFNACLEYVRTEPIPGDWDGVYAGMDSHDRQAAAR